MSGRARGGTTRRPFTLFDGMILVAGIGAGFAWLRLSPPETLEGLGRNPYYWRFWRNVGLEVGGVLLVVCSSMVLAFRVRKPRPALRRVARQPGFAACFVAVTLAVGSYAFESIRYAYEWVRQRGGIFRGDAFSVDWLYPDDRTAIVVASVWILYAIGRIGRPEPGWVDRAGRLLGWCWIIWGIGRRLLHVYYAFEE